MSGFELDPHPLLCIEDILKACLSDLHGNEIFVDCYREGCWKVGPEITADRAAVNIYSPNEQNADQQDTLSDCGFDRQKRVAQFVFETHSISCHKLKTYTDAQQRCYRSWHLVCRTLACCWKERHRHNMLWERMSLAGLSMDFKRDTAESDLHYAVLIASINITYSLDLCSGKILRCP